MSAIFKIKILNWEKHNGKMKRGHKSTLIANNLGDHAGLRTLPVSVRWLYVNILLTCGDHTRDTVEMSESRLRDLLESSWSVSRALGALQRLQLLSFEKLPLIEENGIEIKRKEEKRREEKEGAMAEPALLPVVTGPPPLVEIWNSHRGPLPECKAWSGTRAKKIQQRWKEQSPEAWIETIKRLAASTFCTGKNDRGWRADFDFLLKPDSWQKINDGKYDNNRGSISTVKTRTYDKLDELEQEWREKTVAAQ